MTFRPAASGRLLLFFLAAFLSGAASAQGTPPVQGLLWKATLNGFSVYLVGSIHFGSKEMYPLPKPFEDAYNQATDLIEELDFNNLRSEEVQAKALQAVAYPPSDSLTHHVSAPTLDLVRQYAKKAELPYENLCLLRPWALAYTLPFLAAMKNPPKTPPVPGIDDYFAKKAKEGHKKVVAVETPDYQFNVLADLSARDQEDFLVAVLKTVIAPPSAGGQSDMAIMQGFWAKGDADGLNGYVEKSFSVFPASYVQHLLYDRNLHMMEVLERYVKYRKLCLMIVGAGHLIGPKGIVKALMDKGYQVTQILGPVAPTSPSVAGQTASPR